MNAWIAWAFGLPGFAALSFAMGRHQQQVFGRALRAQTALAWRIVGGVLLALSVAVCATAWSWSIAIAAWLGVLTFAALGTGLALTYRPRWLLPLAAMALGAGMAGWLAHALGG